MENKEPDDDLFDRLNVRKRRLAKTSFARRVSADLSHDCALIPSPRPQF